MIQTISTGFITVQSTDSISKSIFQRKPSIVDKTNNQWKNNSIVIFKAIIYTAHSLASLKKNHNPPPSLYIITKVTKNNNWNIRNKNNETNNKLCALTASIIDKNYTIVFYKQHCQPVLLSTGFLPSTFCLRFRSWAADCWYKQI